MGQPTEQARQTQKKAKVGLWGEGRGGRGGEEMGEERRGGKGRTQEDGDREREIVLGGDKSALK